MSFNLIVSKSQPPKFCLKTNTTNTSQYLPIVVRGPDVAGRQDVQWKDVGIDDGLVSLGSVAQSSWESGQVYTLNVSLSAPS